MPTLLAAPPEILDPRALPLEALADNIRTEAVRYRNGEAADDSFAVELFRRAASGDDPLAWDLLISLYRPHVLACLRRHPAWADRAEPDDDYWIMRVFQRFWYAIKADRLQIFERLAAILAYLKMCAHSVLLDEARSARAASISLDDAFEASDNQPDVAAQVIGRLSSKMVWQIVLGEAQGDQEPIIAHMSWVQGMRPAEIYAARPGLFDTVDDVYRIKRNLLMRLRRNPRLADLLA